MICGCRDSLDLSKAIVPSYQDNIFDEDVNTQIGRMLFSWEIINSRGTKEQSNASMLK